METFLIPALFRARYMGLDITKLAFRDPDKATQTSPSQLQRLAMKMEILSVLSFRYNNTFQKNIK